MQPAVILFDLDGVLVQPGGYRAAVRETLNYFTQQMGLPSLAPDDETIAIFEAQGIICEWDMIPITLAVMLEAAAARLDGKLSLNSLQAASDSLRGISLEDFQVDYAPVLRQLGQYTCVGEAPAESLLALCESGQGREIFPRLSKQGVLRELFTNTRRPDSSRTTHVFQTYVLGDEVFTEAMGLPAEVQTESLLARHDRPLLAPEIRDRLLVMRDEGLLRMAAYTARPSLPLGESAERLVVFTPEAEMALNLVGLETIPVMGSGQMGEAAWKLGEREDRLTKPAPYHALAAAVAAWTGNRLSALTWIQQVFNYFERGGTLPTLDTGAGSLPAQLELHVFEDSPSGLSGGKEAARMLSKLGVDVQVKLWGVSPHPEKAEALARVGAQVFADVNQALAAAFPG